MTFVLYTIYIPSIERAPKKNEFESIREKCALTHDTDEAFEWNDGQKKSERPQNRAPGEHKRAGARFEHDTK